MGIEPTSVRRQVIELVSFEALAGVHWGPQSKQLSRQLASMRPRLREHRSPTSYVRRCDEAGVEQL